MGRSKDHVCVHVILFESSSRGGGRDTCATASQGQAAENELRCQHISMHNNRGLLDDHLVDRVNAHLDSPTCMILSRMSVIHFCYSSGFLAMVGPLRNEDSF